MTAPARGIWPPGGSALTIRLPRPERFAESRTPGPLRERDPGQAAYHDSHGTRRSMRSSRPLGKHGLAGRTTQVAARSAFVAILR